MKTKFKYRSLTLLFCAAVIAAAVQESCPPIGVYGVKPELLMCVAIYYAVRRDVTCCIISALICGFFADGISQTGSGGMALYGLVSAGGWFARRQLPENAVSCALVAFPGCFGAGILSWCAAFLGDNCGLPAGGGAAFAFVRIFLNSLVTCGAAFVVSVALGCFDDLLGNTERSADEECG